MELLIHQATPLTILIIDDDQNDALLLELAFSMGEVKTDLHFVLDGQEAIAYLEGKPPFENRCLHPEPGLILLDLKMPKVSGFHVLEWLRDHRSLSKTPIAVLTGSDAPDQVALSYALGADAFLIKPCDFSRLASMVQSLAKYCIRLRRRVKRTTVPVAMASEDLFSVALKSAHTPAAAESVRQHLTAGPHEQ
jgi:CheY-like chemotaxis protein